MLFHRIFPFIALPVLFLAAAPAALACSGCGCTLSTDNEALNPETTTGLRIDGRFDYIDLNDLRLGGKHATADNAAPGEEIQHRTRTSMYNLGVDYMPSTAWGVNLSIPVWDRFHTSATGGLGDSESASKWTELSDIRLLARYLGLFESRNYGILAGVKLPTGSAKTNFHSGPAAAALLDRGLQPGTGTTDLLIGFSQRGKFSDDWSWFAQQLLQRPINEHADFRPGTTLNANIGVRYALTDVFVPQLQLNGQNRWRDVGANADRPHSGAEVLYVSPGLVVNLTEDTNIYTFVQVPIYQRLGGLELAPRYTVSVGISHHF